MTESAIFIQARFNKQVAFEVGVVGEAYLGLRYYVLIMACSPQP